MGVLALSAVGCKPPHREARRFQKRAGSLLLGSRSCHQGGGLRPCGVWQGSDAGAAVVYTEEQLLGNRWPSLEQLQLTLPQVEVPEVRETIAHSGLFTRLCLRAFKECDVDKSGTVDRKELHVMLLLLYDKLNRKLPCHVNPPKRSDVERLLAIHDVDGSGGLDPSEFLALSRSLILSKAHWKESLFVKLSLGVAFHMALLPVIAFGFKSILMVAGVASAARLPTAVLAGGIGTVGTLAWNYFKEEGRTREGEVDVEE